MSDFIYNDNLNGGNGEDKEPIHFYFGSEKVKSGVKTTTLVTVCIFCILISALLGILGGMLVARSMTEESSPSDVHININQGTENKLPNILSETGSISRADVVESIKDTVVEVRTQYAVFDNYLTQSGAGSGVIIGNYKIEDEETGKITEQGYHIITNAHVIAEAVSSDKSTITVTLTDGTNYEAQVVGSDTISDIAVLKIQETKTLSCATIASESYDLRVGEDIIAIGNPLGQLGGTVTNGYVSALDREIEIDDIKMNLLQIDAPINPGNSGGGLFNLKGELVGIVNAKSIGTDIEGLGFAIPINDASKIYKEFVTLGYVTGRPTIFAEYDMVYKGSVYVTKILEREDGDNSDKLQLHDQIWGIRIDGNDTAISSAQDLDAIINSAEIGSELILLVRRGTQYGSVTVTVYEYYE